jgi:tetratricopeptide (TPR) repeat protein
VILRDVLKAPFNIRSQRSIEIYDAIFWYYQWQKLFNEEVLEKAILALETAVKNDPDDALAWAMLSELYTSDKALATKKVKNPREEGLRCALRAITIDPNCQHGYQSLAWVYLFYHNREDCLRAVNNCIALNPNAAGIVGTMGFVLTCAGEFERGFELLNSSIRNNPFCPWWFNAGYVLYYLHKREYREALRYAEKIDKPDILWDPLLKTVALGHLDRFEEAGKSLQQLTRILPDTEIQVKNVIESFLLSADLNTEILEGLSKATLHQAVNNEI